MKWAADSGSVDACHWSPFATDCRSGRTVGLEVVAMSVYKVIEIIGTSTMSWKMRRPPQ
jgi:hypothetical protein